MDYINRAKKFRAKKRLGQNFLVDYNAIETILSFVDEDDDVFEIGPGLGFVTENLVVEAKKVTACEIDTDAIEILNNNLGGYDNFNLIEQDVLKFDLSTIEKDNKLKVIANIPYYITSPILLHLLGEIDDFENENRKCIDEIILMVQFEVAKRLVATPESINKEYSSLSILAQHFCDIEIVKKVPSGCFFPSPKVDSAIVRFKVNDKARVENQSKLLRKVVKSGFLARRKNVKNSLSQGGLLNVVEVLDKLNIDQNIRAEKLSVHKLNEIALALEEFNS